MTSTAPDRFMVIGSNCFTGAHIVDALLEKRHGAVIGVSRSPQPHPVFLPYHRHAGAGFTFHRIDVTRDFDALRTLLDQTRPAVVIHVAALSEVAQSNETPVDYFQTNTLAVVKLCDHLRRQNWLRQYVHISSAEMLGPCDQPLDESAPFRPSTPYAVSKAAADMFIHTLIQLFRFPATLIRSTNVYGRHQQLYKIIPRTAIYLKLGRTIELHGGGGAKKSFIHVRDVVDGLFRAVDQRATGTFHLSVDSDQTVADVVHTVCRKMGYDPAATTRVVGERPGQDSRYWLNCDRARNELGWRPTVPMDRGLDEVIAWVNEHWSTIRHMPLHYTHRP